MEVASLPQFRKGDRVRAVRGHCAGKVGTVVSVKARPPCVGSIGVMPDDMSYVTFFARPTELRQLIPTPSKDHGDE